MMHALVRDCTVIMPQTQMKSFVTESWESLSDFSVAHTCMHRNAFVWRTTADIFYLRSVMHS